MNMNENNLITIDSISKTYHNKGTLKIKAVDDVSLTIKKGEVLGLVGESGCGKSTLANIILNLLKPSSGSVFYKEQNISNIKKRDEKEFRKNIQIIFQDPYSSLNPSKTIGFLIEEALKIHKIEENPKERDLIVNTILRLVGLDESYKTRYPRELSGGQRQRVMIASALILEPEFVVCDEAVSALDVSVQAQILNLLLDLKERMQLTYLFISHNLGVVSYIADRIAVMYLGKIVEIGSTDDMIKNPLHPYTKALFASSFDLNSNADKFDLEGEAPSPLNPPSGCSFHPRCKYKKDICIKEYPKQKEVDNKKVSCHLYN